MTDQQDSEQGIETTRLQGGVFVEAVRVTRMPMILTDTLLPNNPIIFANKAFLDLSGYSSAELMGRNPNFLTNDSLDGLLKPSGESVVDGDDENQADLSEVMQYKKDGTPTYVVIFVTEIRDDTGRVIHHFRSHLDVTARYNAEQSLRELATDLERRVMERTVELTDLVKQKEVLLAEVNHRAKNSLAIASSIMGIQTGKMADSRCKELMNEARSKISSMARVHDLLSKSDELTHVEMGNFIADLCGSLGALAEPDQEVTVTGYADKGIVLSAKTAIPLGIILTELVTNSFKYAFKPYEPGEVTLKAVRVGEMIVLSARDTGPGITTIRKGSLGYGLIRGLVRQVEGSLAMNNDDGFTVTITFPENLP